MHGRSPGRMRRCGPPWSGDPWSGARPSLRSVRAPDAPTRAPAARTPRVTPRRICAARSATSSTTRRCAMSRRMRWSARRRPSAPACSTTSSARPQPAGFACSPPCSQASPCAALGGWPRELIGRDRRVVRLRLAVFTLAILLLVLHATVAIETPSHRRRGRGVPGDDGRRHPARPLAAGGGALRGDRRRRRLANPAGAPRWRCGCCPPRSPPSW